MLYMLFTLLQDLLDYAVDSDDEWEEEEPGESLSHSEVVPSCASVYCHATHIPLHGFLHVAFGMFKSYTFDRK